jgi:hypothetical protein
VAAAFSRGGGGVDLTFVGQTFFLILCLPFNPVMEVVLSIGDTLTDPSWSLSLDLKFRPQPNRPRQKFGAAATFGARASPA